MKTKERVDPTLTGSSDRRRTPVSTSKPDVRRGVGRSTAIGSPGALSVMARRLERGGSVDAHRALLQLQRLHGNRRLRETLDGARRSEEREEAAGLAPSGAGAAHAEHEVAAEGRADGEPTVPHEVERAIERKRGGGQTLDDGVRRQMEDAFGTDFSEVTIHRDEESDTLNRALSARAFTVGHDIFFARGTYRPATKEGKELLAHELTHVVQQRRGAIQGRWSVSRPGDPLEREADEVARAVVQQDGERSVIGRDEYRAGTTPSGLHRQEETEEGDSAESEAREEFEREEEPPAPRGVQRMARRHGSATKPTVNRETVVQRNPGCSPRITRTGLMGGSVDKGIFPSKVRGSFDVAASDSHLSIALNANAASFYLIWTSIGSIGFTATVDITCSQVGSSCEINANERPGSVFSEQDAPASGGISIRSEKRADNTVLALTPRVGAAVGGGGSVGAGVGPYSVGVSFPDSSQDRVRSLGTFLWSCEES